jgi:hypothetical protein
LGIVAPILTIEIIILRRAVVSLIWSGRTIGVGWRVIRWAILILRMRLRRRAILGLWRTIIMWLLRQAYAGKRGKARMIAPNWGFFRMSFSF